MQFTSYLKELFHRKIFNVLLSIIEIYFYEDLFEGIRYPCTISNFEPTDMMDFINNQLPIYHALCADSGEI